MKGIILLLSFAISAGALTGSYIDRANMLYRRSDHSASVIGDSIYLFGGCTADEPCTMGSAGGCGCPQLTASLTKYIVENDTFVDLTPAPLARTRHAASVIGTNLYIFGGRDLSDTIIQYVHIYNTVTNTWSNGTTWANATSDLATFTYNNTIYASGGYNQNYGSLNDTYTYRPTTTNAWSYDEIPDMNTGRGDTCAVIYNGIGYVLGGWSDEDNFCTPLSEVEGYNFATNRWTIDANMNVNGGDKACAVFRNDIQVFGGETKNSNCSAVSSPSADAESYNPATNTWTQETSLVLARYRFAAATWISSAGVQRLFVFGGTGRYDDTTRSLPTLFSVVEFIEPEGTTSTTRAATGGAANVIASAAMIIMACFAVILM